MGTERQTDDLGVLINSPITPEAREALIRLADAVAVLRRVPGRDVGYRLQSALTYSENGLVFLIRAIRHGECHEEETPC